MCCCCPWVVSESARRQRPRLKAAGGLHSRQGHHSLHQRRVVEAAARSVSGTAPSSRSSCSLAHLQLSDRAAPQSQGGTERGMEGGKEGGRQGSEERRQ